jgi:two-component system, LytTR family, response regulator AlgR
MRILIVDDEAPARHRLQDMLADIRDANIVGTASNGSEALQLAHQLHPDVVLMDIRMPGMDGLEAAEHISSLAEAPAVIFTTAYSDHALAAFEANAIDYLLKPVRLARLEQALQKAQRLSGQQLSEAKKQAGEPARTHILVRHRSNMVLVPVHDILYFQADLKYVTLAHTQGEALIEESLRHLEEEFADRFLRIHRNALVNTAYILGIEKNQDGQLYLVLRDHDARLEISRRHAAEVRHHIRDRGA